MVIPLFTVRFRKLINSINVRRKQSPLTQRNSARVHKAICIYNKGWKTSARTTTTIERACCKVMAPTKSDSLSMATQH